MSAPAFRHGETMRIAILAGAFPLRSETFIVDHLVALHRRGIDVHLVSAQASRPDQQLFDHLLAPLAEAGRLHIDPDTAGTLLRLEPDVVHAQFGTLGRTHLGVPAEQRNAPLLVSFRGFDVVYQGVEIPDYYDDVWSGADMLHFVSHSLRRRAIERGCPPGRPMTVIEDAVDPGWFAPGPRPAIDSRTSTPLRIVSVGRLHWKKGHVSGLFAAAELVRRGVPFRWRIVGAGAELEQLRYTIDELGLAEVVELLGAADREVVRQELQDADVMFHPSISEGFAVSVLEAQAMALPVVCTDAEGLRENVDDGVTGLVVPRRDAIAMANALELFARDRVAARRMGAAGRQRVIDRFTCDRQTDRFLALYRAMANPGPAAGGIPTPGRDRTPIASPGE